MTTRSDASATWSVGELSAATGLSERVLRHWERMGLVSPTRTHAGHRRYGSAQITRLYRAMALRRTGLSLRRVADLLELQDPDPVATLRAHLAEIEGDLKQRLALRDKLADALDQFEAPPTSDDTEPAGAAALLMKVIETMTMFDQYVHGYHPEENLRLRDQAGTLVDLIHDGVAYPTGSAVLEVGCGVGAQTVSLAQRNPTAMITAVDRATASVSEARRRVAEARLDNVSVAEADVYQLPHDTGPLAAGTFDHVFVCFLLEHLDRPVQALRNMRRLLRPGGTITVVEGDHGSAYFHPDNDAARDIIAAQVTLQRNAGGDALIGRQLFPLLVQAGFGAARVEPRTVYVDASRPDLVDGFTRKTFTAMIAGIREPAVAAGLVTPEVFDAGIQGLHRTTEADGVFCYTFFRGVAANIDTDQAAS